MEMWAFHKHNSEFQKHNSEFQVKNDIFYTEINYKLTIMILRCITGQIFYTGTKLLRLWQWDLRNINKGTEWHDCCKIRSHDILSKSKLNEQKKLFRQPDSSMDFRYLPFKVAKPTWTMHVVWYRNRPFMHLMDLSSPWSNFSRKKNLCVSKLGTAPNDTNIFTDMFATLVLLFTCFTFIHFFGCRQQMIAITLEVYILSLEINISYCKMHHPN